MTPPLIVAGCPRGGTSLFAKLLVAAGLTTVADGRANAKYPSGYYEHLPLMMFHKAMERFPRQSNQRPDYVPTAEPFLKTEYLNDPFVATMAETAFAPVRSGKTDFLKYPQLALSADFLFDAIPDLRLVLVWRDPVASVRSLASYEFGRDMFPFRGLRSVLLWNTYAAHVCRAKERHGDRVAVVHIDRVVEGVCAVDRVMAGLGFTIPAVPVEAVVDPRVWTRHAKLRDHARAAVLDRIATATARRLGADPSLTSLGRWAERLEAASTS